MSQSLQVPVSTLRARLTDASELPCRKAETSGAGPAEGDSQKQDIQRLCWLLPVEPLWLTRLV